MLEKIFGEKMSEWVDCKDRLPEKNGNFFVAIERTIFLTYPLPELLYFFTIYRFVIDDPVWGAKWGQEDIGCSFSWRNPPAFWMPIPLLPLPKPPEVK